MNVGFILIHVHFIYSNEMTENWRMVSICVRMWIVFGRVRSRFRVTHVGWMSVFHITSYSCQIYIHGIVGEVAKAHLGSCVGR